MALPTLAAALAAFPSQASAERVSTDELNAADLRLATVGYRLAVANADRCVAPALLTGVLLHDLGQYPPAERAATAARYGLSDGVGVLGTVPGSAADTAGLRAGDEILAVDGADLRVAAAALPGRVTYDRVDGATKLLQSGTAQGGARLTVRHDGATRDVVLRGVAGCGGNTVVSPSDMMNAWSDGRHVVVTMRLLATTADDDELAFVVAHEMSHNNLRHQERLGNAVNGLFSAFGSKAARIKTVEIEADTAAIGVMQAAGYDTGAAARFLERAGRGRILDLATTHPRTGRRVEIVSAAIRAMAMPAQAWGSVQVASIGPAPLPMAGLPGLAAGAFRLPDTGPAVLPQRARVAGMVWLDAVRVEEVAPRPVWLGFAPVSVESIVAAGSRDASGQIAGTAAWLPDHRDVTRPIAAGEPSTAMSGEEAVPLWAGSDDLGSAFPTAENAIWSKTSAGS